MDKYIPQQVFSCESRPAERHWQVVTSIKYVHHCAYKRICKSCVYVRISLISTYLHIYVWNPKPNMEFPTSTYVHRYGRDVFPIVHICTYYTCKMRTQLLIWDEFVCIYVCKYVQNTYEYVLVGDSIFAHISTYYAYKIHTPLLMKFYNCCFLARLACL